MSIVIPDGIDPVVAWKGFHVVNGQLYSPSTATPWVPNEIATAQCGRAYPGQDPEHEAPAEACECGIYMVKDKPYAASYGPVLVQMNGWGRVKPASRGYRVQYAYPKKIFVPTKEVEKFLIDYGVPVVVDKKATTITKKSMHRRRVLYAAAAFNFGSSILNYLLWLRSDAAVSLAACAFALIMGVFMLALARL